MFAGMKENREREKNKPQNDDALYKILRVIYIWKKNSVFFFYFFPLSFQLHVSEINRDADEKCKREIENQMNCICRSDKNGSYSNRGSL